MELRDLVKSVLAHNLISARQWVDDARRTRLDWSRVEQPSDLDARELAVAAGLVELLAERAAVAAPAWTARVKAVATPILLDPGLESMPRTLARAREHGPAGLRRHNLVACEGFLDVR